MTIRPSDLWDYDEEMPPAWQKSIQDIATAGANPNGVEAEKLKMQIALMTVQANVSLHVSDRADDRSKREADEADVRSKRENAQAGLRAEAELEAAKTRAEAADTIAKSLKRATWFLFGATVGLVIATLLLFLKPGV